MCLSACLSVCLSASALPARGMLALSAARRLLRPPGDLLPPPGLACIWAAGARGCSGAGAGSQNPVVYLEVGADNQPLGRVVLEVRTRGMRGPVVRPGPGYGGRRAARSGRAGGRGAEGRREGLELPLLLCCF